MMFWSGSRRPPQGMIAITAAILILGTTTEAVAQPGRQNAQTRDAWARIRDPRTAVLAVLGSVAVIGVARKWVQHARARRGVGRLAEEDVTAEEIETAAEHGREGLMEFFRILGTDADARKRDAAGHALAVLWAQDQLIAEEEKAIVTRGYVVTWKARRRYPRGMTRPIPVEAEFGVPSLRTDGKGVRPDNLEWSYRIAGSERASLESYSSWLPGPCQVAFEVNPADFPGKGPHRLALHARVRTRGLTSAWELDLPHIPFTFEFDPILALDAILTLPDEHRAEQIAAAVRLETPRDPGEGEAHDGPSPPRFLNLDDQFALRDPAEVVVRTPLPSDLAHSTAVEFEGVEGTFPAGFLTLLSGQGTEAAHAERRFPIGPLPDFPAGRIDRPGERRMRLILTADPERGWADPDIRSLWPGTITTDWHPVRIVRQ